MSRRYTPRRANKKRWLEGAPPYVLDVLDSKGPGERYTVLFTGSLLIRRGASGSFADTFVPYLGMDDAPTHPQGISMWGELSAYDTAWYRYRCGWSRIRWLDLPEHIRNHVMSRATEGDTP